MEIWDVIKGLFMLFVLIPLVIAVIYFLCLHLPLLIILRLYDYITYKSYQYFKIDISNWFTVIICILFVRRALYADGKLGAHSYSNDRCYRISTFKKS